MKKIVVFLLILFSFSLLSCGSKSSFTIEELESELQENYSMSKLSFNEDQQGRKILFSYNDNTSVCSGKANKKRVVESISISQRIDDADYLSDEERVLDLFNKMATKGAYSLTVRDLSVLDCILTANAIVSLIDDSEPFHKTLEMFYHGRIINTNGWSISVSIDSVNNSWSIDATKK